MRIHCCQLDIKWENKPENFRRVRNLLSHTILAPGSLLVLPEMFATGFSMNADVICEQAQGETAEFLRELARQHQLYVLGGVAMREVGTATNQALAFSPEGELIARYAKIHPFSLGEETKHYARGTEIVSFEWNGLKVVPFICYDLRFPEIFRHATREGAEMFLVIANWPNRREGHWTTLLQARAIENLAFVAGVNRSGADPQHHYSGRSLIVDPHGRVLADAGNAEGIIHADIDPQTVTSWRKDFPALNDMHWRG